MLIETNSTLFRKARSVNQTSNGYVSKVPTNTEPGTPNDDAGTATGTSVIKLSSDSGSSAQNQAIIVPYGTGSNNGTFLMRAIGWRYVGTDPTTRLWIPVVLGEWTCTLSSSIPGVAGKTIVATELFADTIVIVGTTGGDNALGISSPAADIMAYIILDLRGSQKLELTFTTGGSATDCNALVALI